MGISPVIHVGASTATSTATGRRGGGRRKRDVSGMSMCGVWAVWLGGGEASPRSRHAGKKFINDAIADGAHDGDQPTSDAPIYGRGSPHPISIRMMLMGVWCMGWHGRMAYGECGWVVAASRSVEGGWCVEGGSAPAAAWTPVPA